MCRLSEAFFHPRFSRSQEGLRLLSISPHKEEKLTELQPLLQSQHKAGTQPYTDVPKTKPVEAMAAILLLIRAQRQAQLPDHHWS